MTLSRRAVVTGALGLGVSGCMGAPVRPIAVPGCDAAPLPTDTAGFDTSKLASALDAFDHDLVNLHGLVVQRHGKLAGERYRTGTDRTVSKGDVGRMAFDACTLHDVRSISKSVTSLCWGVAQGMGKTPPLDTPALSLFPKLKDLAVGGREKITLRHLLTMTSGLEWNEENYGSATNPETDLYWRNDQARTAFDRPVETPPGTKFNYSGGNTAVMALLLERYTGVSLTAFADAHLFKPLGITAWEWAVDLHHRPLAFAGLRLRPRDLAKLGELLLGGGAWNGQQVVPAAWIAESTRAHIETGDGLHYGYFWWLGEVEAVGARHPYIAGFGNGGQRIFAVPSLALNVAITSGEYDRPGQRHSRDVFKRIAATLV